MRHSSFAFRVASGGDEWTVTDQQYPLRRLVEAELVDVAPVVDPAYTDATAGLRSLASHMNAPIEDVLEMAQKDELRRFFIRTDNRGPVRTQPKPSKPREFGAAAVLAMRQRESSPLDTDVA